MIEPRGCNAAENRKRTTEKPSNIVAKSHWLSETPRGVTPLCTNPQRYGGRTDLTERTAEIAVEVQVSGKAMSETEVFTATATGIYGVRVGEDHVSGTEDGKLGNAVLVELTNTLTVPLDLAKKTV